MHIQPVAPARILSTLRPGHPRLLLTPERLALLRSQSREIPRLRQWVAALRRRADELIAAPSETAGTIPSRSAMERLFVLGTVGALTGDPACAAAAADAIRRVTERTDWRYAAHARTVFDLGMAETCAALAVCRDLLAGQLPADADAAAARWMRDSALPRALEHYRRPPGTRYWPDNHNNWNQVCNGGVILAALSIADTDPALASDCLAEAVRSLPNAMQEFAPDGGWLEGSNYWRYATLFNCMALDALQNALGTDCGLSRAPGFDRTGYFYLHACSPDARPFNFADSSAYRFGAPQLWWLARRFSDPGLAVARLRMIEEDERLIGKTPQARTVSEHGVQGTAVQHLDVLWYDHDLAEAPAEDPPTDSHFKKAGVVTLRGRWNAADTTFVGFKAGCATWSHAHLDAGTFVLDALGQRWAEELGADSYSLPGYFETWAGSARRHYSFYRIRPEGHNTLVLDPHIQPQQDPTAESAIVRTGFHAGHAFAVADLSPAYRRQSAAVLRGVRLDRAGGQVVLRDEIRSAAAVDCWWFMHTRAAVTLGDGGRTAVLELGGQRLWISLLTPDKGAFEIMEARPMVHSPDPAGQSRNDGYRKLSLHLEVAQNPTVTVWFVPLSPGETMPSARPAVEDLCCWW